jgi:hypothetical protein
MSIELDISVPADISTARALTDEVKADAAALWAKLLDLYERGVHTTLGYSSWGRYYEAEFGQSARRGEQLVAAGRVVREIESTNNCSLTESVARELVPLKDDTAKLREVWGRVVQKHGENPTAKQTRPFVDRVITGRRRKERRARRVDAEVVVSSNRNALPEAEALNRFVKLVEHTFTPANVESLSPRAREMFVVRLQRAITILEGK